jgi:hypothetical protein
MTLEDDVESMLSEHFNASNESMFRIRPGGIALGAGQNLLGGDSTYRGLDDSVFGFDEDKGLISESEDGGWYASDREGGDRRHQRDGLKQGNDDEFDDISEHSSDDVSDSEEEQVDAQGQTKKVKKPKGEKGERKKKKKKKAEAEAAGM